jgi:2,3-bisphosphoglycerate-independent phosphoglycerate mutase
MTRSANGPLALIILDGWDDADSNGASIINRAFTPNYDSLRTNFPKTTLVAGTDAAAGHLTIGAGRDAETEVSVVSDALRGGVFAANETLNAAMRNAAEKGTAVHLVGLLSDSGIHSLPDSIYSLLRMAKVNGIADVFIHGILDGRDVEPRTADIYIEALEIKMADIGVGRIATLCGRFFAMDTEENWERTARAFTMLVHSEGERAKDPIEAVRGSFLRGISDEFISPIILENDNGEPVAKVKDGDTVIFFDHRADGMRQLVRSLAAADEGQRGKVDIVCLTEYDRSLELPVAFHAAPVKEGLAEIMASFDIENFRISDATRANELANEFMCGFAAENSREQILPAADVLTLESEPEMKSFKIADAAINSIDSGDGAVYLVNMPALASLADGGSEKASIEAVQYIDTCLGGVFEKVLDKNGVALITSSHAASGRVPFHLIDGHHRETELAGEGSLCDVAPTILGVLGIEKPASMTGRDLRIG